MGQRGSQRSKTEDQNLDGCEAETNCKHITGRKDFFFSYGCFRAKMENLSVFTKGRNTTVMIVQQLQEEIPREMESDSLPGNGL